jgi:hypothetical protein
MIEYLPTEPQSFPATQVHNSCTGAKHIKQDKLTREKHGKHKTAPDHKEDFRRNSEQPQGLAMFTATHRG